MRVLKKRDNISTISQQGCSETYGLDVLRALAIRDGRWTLCSLIRLGFFLWRKFLPPQMTRQVHCPSLVGLLQQFRTMQCGLRYQCIVVINTKDLRALECPDNERDSLKLCPTLRDTLFVDGESLNVKIIREIFKSTFIGYLGREEEETKSY